MSSGRKELSVADADRLLASLSGEKAVGREVADLQLPPGMKWKSANARGVVFRNVDWPGPGIKGGLFGRGHIQECRFEKVNLDSLRCRKVDFADCRFESVTFGEHYFGNLNDCSFVKCTFIKCRFDAVAFVQSSLRSCRFEGIKAERARWRDCSLEDVWFSGRLTKVSFIDNSLRQVDLSSVEMLDCAFLGGKQEDLLLPDQPRNFAIDPRIMGVAEERLRPKLGAEALANYRHFAQGASQFGPCFLINAGILTVLSPEDREVVMATLYEMRHTAAS